MADKVVPVDVRNAIVSWSDDAPRGAVSRFCAEHGVSRSQFYAIRARAKSEGPVAAMLPRPREPVRVPQAVPIEVEELAVRIRKEQDDKGWDNGPITVHWKLRDLGVAAPAPSTLARIFTRRGLVVAQPQKRPKSSIRRFEAATVHECWQMDGFEWTLADGTKFVILQLTDDKSRFPIATAAVPGERSADAIALVKAGIDRFQVPCRLLTDNGSAFNQNRMGRRTKLVEFCESVGCKPVTGRPGHPQTQGKNERAHQPLQRFLRARSRPASLAQAQIMIGEFDTTFADRRHQGIGMRTPAQALADGPVAIPPLAPEPAEQPGPAVRAHQNRVASTGNVTALGVRINVGYQLRGTTVTVIRSGQSISIFDQHGTQIRSVHVEPGRTYYGNGQPRGPRPKPKCPD